MKLQENSVFANRYELQKLLGRGGFSEVWLAKDQFTHLNVAIKVYAPGQGMEEDGMKEFCGELAGVYDINHPNLLKPQHVDTWENMPYLIMAYCPNGSCAKMIGKATEEQMWKVIHDVASGLAYLHGKGLVHQDIKPANVMIDEDGDYLITDFGVSSRARSTLRKSVVSSTGGGTTAYMGPERFSQQPAPTKASDIWSFGAMCFEMVEGYVPFGENGGVSQKIGADIPLMSAEVSDALKYAITMMLQKETWDRPTAATLMEWSENPAAIQIDRSIISDEYASQTIVDKSRQTVKQGDAHIEEAESRSTVRRNEPSFYTPKQSLSSVKKWMIIGIAALVFVIICVVLVWNNGEQSIYQSTGQEYYINLSCGVSDARWFVDGIDYGQTDHLNVKLLDGYHVVQIESEMYDTFVDSFLEINKNSCTNFSFSMNLKDSIYIWKDSIYFKMILVRGGDFEMGSNCGDKDEKPVHSVTLDSYYIGETEVTQLIWRLVMGDYPNEYKGDDMPVENVNWEDCQKFIKRLNEKTGKTFALPTEAQWEYAARGGRLSRGYKYSGSNTINEVAWYWGNTHISGVHPVKKKKPNELGIYDMTGNVNEICGDWYGEYQSQHQTNPEGPSSGKHRVYRGGSCTYDAVDCRSTKREIYNSSYISIGLRLVLIP